MEGRPESELGPFCASPIACAAAPDPFWRRPFADPPEPDDPFEFRPAWPPPDDFAFEPVSVRDADSSREAVPELVGGPVVVRFVPRSPFCDRAFARSDAVEAARVRSALRREREVERRPPGSDPSAGPEEDEEPSD